MISSQYVLHFYLNNPGKGEYLLEESPPSVWLPEYKLCSGCNDTFLLLFPFISHCPAGLHHTCTTAVQRFTLKVWRWALAERLTELTCYTMKWKQIQQWLQRSNLQTRELIINSAVYRLSVLTCCFSAEYLSFFTKTSVPQWHHADKVSLLQTALEISQTFSWASSKCKIWLIY